MNAIFARGRLRRRFSASIGKGASMTHRYAMQVFWSDEDGAWIATAPDLPFCSAHGDMPAEALAELQVAIEGVLAVMRDKGHPLPEPRWRPAA